MNNKYNFHKYYSKKIKIIYHVIQLRIIRILLFKMNKMKALIKIFEV